jgi:hypothetical protein
MKSATVANSIAVGFGRPPVQSSPMRRLTQILVVLATLLAFPAAASADVKIWFLQGEQLISVDRPGSSADDALAALIAGPTTAEKAKAVRTYVPAGTPVRALSVSDGVATVDLGDRFAGGSNAERLLARLSQLVRTLTSVPGTTKVKLLIDGGTVYGLFPGVSTEGPLTVKYLQTPDLPTPKPPVVPTAPENDGVRDVQQRLLDLGYLVQGDVDGQFGPATSNALLAFQKWEGLDRTGQLDDRTRAKLAMASRPTPISRGGSGKRAEILIDRQVALLIQDNQVVRAIPVSTGKPSTPTPPGDYRVLNKIPRWWSVPFREWLPWAVQFVGGIAFHEFPDVPTYAASHGCVRQSPVVARWTFDFAEIGMPVKVIARS